MRRLLNPLLLLPSATLLVSASQHSFSVSDDLLAYPQYEIHFRDDYIHVDDAERRLHEKGEVKVEISSSSTEVDRAQRESRSHDGSSKDTAKVISATYERMVLDGHDFLCKIPVVEPPTVKTDGQNETLAKAERAKELARAIDRGWELLSGMQDNCIYYTSGWWSYSFCYGQGVKQFHQLPPTRGVPVYPPIEDLTVPGYELGLYRGNDAAASAADDVEETTTADLVSGSTATGRTSAMGASAELVERGESRYLVQRLGHGTKCDLTGKDRRVEVQFHCNPHSADRIALIKETAICTYLMVVHTARLCSDVAFLPQQKDFPNDIDCYPILEDDQIDGYEANLAKLRESEKQDNINTARDEIAAAFGVKVQDKAPRVVGDIVVGAHARIPKDKKLEKGAIVGGGTETYVTTVATSDGKLMSEKELKKHGMTDMKAVKKLTEQLQKFAGKNGWRLDLYDTPQGRQYRGIVEAADDKEKADKAGKTEKQEKKEKKDGPAKSPKTAKKDAEDDETGSVEVYFHEEL